MERDKIVIMNVVSEMLDKGNKLGIYPTTELFNRLEKYIEQERVQALGWMHAEACTVAGNGGDIRKREVPNIIKRAKSDLNLVPTRDEYTLQ
jgi:hypothetical protein